MASHLGSNLDTPRLEDFIGDFQHVSPMINQIFWVPGKKCFSIGFAVAYAIGQTCPCLEKLCFLWPWYIISSSLRPHAAWYCKALLRSFILPTLPHVLVITLLTIVPRGHTWFEKFNILARVNQQPIMTPCRMDGVWVGIFFSFIPVPHLKPNG